MQRLGHEPREFFRAEKIFCRICEILKLVSSPEKGAHTPEDRLYYDIRISLISYETLNEIVGFFYPYSIRSGSRYLKSIIRKPFSG